MNSEQLNNWVDCKDYIPNLPQDTIVAIKVRNDRTFAHPKKVENWRWTKRGTPDDIMAYKVVQV